MNDDDLRDCAALMKAITGASPEECYKFADEFLEARRQKDELEPEIGIVAIKPKRTRKP